MTAHAQEQAAVAVVAWRACRDQAGAELARGLTNYASSEARRIARHASSEIEALLGYVEEPELIHRDNLVLAR